MPFWSKSRKHKNEFKPVHGTFTPTANTSNGDHRTDTVNDQDLHQLRIDNSRLKTIAQETQDKVNTLQDTCLELERKLAIRNDEIKRLRDTLVQTTNFGQPGSNKQQKQRRTPIFELTEEKAVNVRRTPKSAEQRKFLTQAIRNNDLLKYLTSDQVSEIIECVQRAVNQNEVFIREGTRGDCLYILESGILEVSQGSTVLRNIHPPTVFGELAILYNCKRTATITAKTPTKVWKLERSVFQSIMRTTAKTRREEVKKTLRKVPLMKTVGEHRLTKLAEVLEEETFQKGEFIIRQGEYGETFYIIMEGEVRVTENNPNTHSEKFIREIGKGSFFGEAALQNESGKRGANVMAQSSVVRCMTLEKKHFLRLIGDRANINWNGTPRSSKASNISYAARISSGSRTSSTISMPVRRMHSIFQSMTLDDLEFIGVLGVGGFGRVELRRSKLNPNQSFALKCLKKNHIVKTKQEEHVFSEKKIMRDADCPFIVQLYRTFKDDRYVYMLLEACLGGELWAKLRDDGHFDEYRTRFYSGCVVEALDYLHQHGIVYRDLKPENLLLDGKGYVKLVDFGFAKTIKHGEKTWTFCGTPEYVAPEVILNKGHDVAVDYWALGILIFEMLTGNPPFNSTDAMKTYRMALRGIDAIDWPHRISKTAQNLIRRLCRDNPSERIGNLNEGVRAIRNHRWFSGFDWNSLTNLTYKVAYVPNITNARDMRNFDKFEKDSYDSAPQEFSGWDAEF